MFPNRIRKQHSEPASCAGIALLSSVVAVASEFVLQICGESMESKQTLILSCWGMGTPPSAHGEDSSSKAAHISFIASIRQCISRVSLHIVNTVASPSHSPSSSCLHLTMSLQYEVEKPGESRTEDKITITDDSASLEKGRDGAELTWTSEEERSALKKLDWNLIPL